MCPHLNHTPSLHQFQSFWRPFLIMSHLSTPVTADLPIVCICTILSGLAASHSSPDTFRTLEYLAKVWNQSLGLCCSRWTVYLLSGVLLLLRVLSWSKAWLPPASSCLGGSSFLLFLHCTLQVYWMYNLKDMFLFASGKGGLALPKMRINICISLSNCLKEKEGKQKQVRLCARKRPQ